MRNVQSPQIPVFGHKLKIFKVIFKSLLPYFYNDNSKTKKEISISRRHELMLFK